MEVTKFVALSRYKTTRITAWLLVLCVAGYPLVGLVAAALDWPSRWGSVPFRLIVAAIALGLAILSWNTRRLTGWSLALVVWLGVYTMRLIYNLAAGYPNAQHELVFFFLTVALPVAALISRSDGMMIDFLMRRPIAILAGVTLIFALGCEHLGWFGANSYTFTGRLSTANVNPLIIGHLSVTLLLACVILHAPEGGFSKVLVLTFAAVGQAALSLSGSRGPVLALLVVLGVWILSSLRIRSSSIFAVVLAGMTLLLFWWPLPIDHLVAQSYRARIELEQGDENIATGTDALPSSYRARIELEQGDIEKYMLLLDQERVERLASTATGTAHDDAMKARVILWQNSWNAAWKHKIFGVSNWETNQGQYPHNLVLEAFQNLGVLGGAAFVGLLLAGARLALKWILCGHPLIPLLFVQSVVGGQFSGSLYAYAPLWVTLALLFGKDDMQRYQKVT